MTQDRASRVANPADVMLADLGLSTRATAALGNASYKVGLHRTVWPKTVAELFANFSVGALLATPKFGEGTFRELVEVLEGMGLLEEGCNPEIMMYRAYRRWKIPEAASISVEIATRSGVPLRPVGA